MVRKVEKMETSGRERGRVGDPAGAEDTADIGVPVGCVRLDWRKCDVCHGGREKK